MNLLNPDVIVLGGWVGRSIGTRRMDALRTAMLTHCLTQPGAAVELRLSRLEEELLLDAEHENPGALELYHPRCASLPHVPIHNARTRRPCEL